MNPRMVSSVPVYYRYKQFIPVYYWHVRYIGPVVDSVKDYLVPLKTALNQ
jgi:hypothetical protein